MHLIHTDSPSETHKADHYHKAEFAVGLIWEEPTLGSQAMYIEVDSPLDQSTRVNGDPPRPWADEPRYAFAFGVSGVLHIAGWHYPEPEGSAMYGQNDDLWRVVDFYIPTVNIIQLEVFKHHMLDDDVEEEGHAPIAN